jgi:hypothetical protein
MQEIIERVLEKAARKLGISPSDASLIYRSYWKFIHDRATSMTPENVSESAFCFNIPYIGKLYTGADKVEAYNKKLEYYKKYVKDKKSKTDISSDTCN